MIAFFNDAPAGALVLIFVGAALLTVEVPIRLRWWQRFSSQAARPIEEDSRPLLPLMLTTAGWGFLIGGFAWYVLAS